MAEAVEVEPSPSRQTHLPPSTPYVEVNCRSSGQTRRFAAGTEAGFAVSLINGKLKRTELVALHIEAVKYGEESIASGPNSILVNFGNGWKLHTVISSDSTRYY
ncbi:hypothetical protein RIF29_25685 [Crotalaria pallida]|uniref:Uncharacterized protein n=1 Tax=Crotalaria pallida TaxID=3830 RepID=A0AAN9HZZ1_CROPI